MLTITSKGIAIDEDWMYETDPYKTILTRVNYLGEGIADLTGSVNIAEMKFVYFSSNILKGNPFSGKDINKEDLAKMKDNSGLPEDWEPDVYVLEAINHYINYQKDTYPTTKAIFNLHTAVHNIARIYDNKNIIINEVSDLIDQKTKVLANAKNSGDKLEVLSTIETLNLIVKSLVSDVVDFTDKLDKINTTLENSYEKLRGDKANSKKLLSKGGKILNKREIVE